MTKTLPEINYKSCDSGKTVQEYITLFDNVVAVLLDLATDNAIHAFVYGLKLWLKGFVKAQVQAMTDAFLNKVMTVALKLEENIQYGFQMQ